MEGREKEGVRERRGAGNEAGKVKEESEERRKKGQEKMEEEKEGRQGG